MIVWHSHSLWWRRQPLFLRFRVYLKHVSLRRKHRSLPANRATKPLFSLVSSCTANSVMDFMVETTTHPIFTVHLFLLRHEQDKVSRNFLGIQMPAFRSSVITTRHHPKFLPVINYRTPPNARLMRCHDNTRLAYVMLLLLRIGSATSKGTPSKWPPVIE